LGIYVGIDWAEAYHDICVLDETGTVLIKRRIADGLEGVGQLHALVADHASEPNQVVVGIETDRGLLVGALLAAGYQVYAINPLAASRYRERHVTSGAKSDPGDAKVLADELLADPYFRRTPPKSAGREQYGEAYARRLLAWGRRYRARPADLARTATVLTALSIVDAFHRWILPRAEVDQLIVSGGGAHNPLLIAQLQAALPRIEMRHSGEWGIPDDAKEAFAFAILAYESYHGRPTNLPAATGAKYAAVLGKICYATRK